MPDHYDLFFELSNEDRVNILRLLQNKHLNLTNISNELELRNQETSRHLSRLESSGLIKRNIDGTYQTTQFAYLVLEKQAEICFLHKQKDYFNSHSLEGISSELVAKLGMLSNSKYVDDTLIALQIVKGIIDGSEDYLFR